MPCSWSRCRLRVAPVALRQQFLDAVLDAPQTGANRGRTAGIPYLGARATPKSSRLYPNPACRFANKIPTRVGAHS